MFPNLTKKQIGEIKITLAARGIKMPKSGWVQNIPEADRLGLQNVLDTRYPPKKIVHESTGWYLIF